MRTRKADALRAARGDLLRVLAGRAEALTEKRRFVRGRWVPVRTPWPVVEAACFVASRRSWAGARTVAPEGTRTPSWALDVAVASDLGRGWKGERRGARRRLAALLAVAGQLVGRRSPPRGAGCDARAPGGAGLVDATVGPAGGSLRRPGGAGLVPRRGVGARHGSGLYGVPPAEGGVNLPLPYRLFSKFRSRCVKCEHQIEEGDPILWHGPGRGAEHTACPESDGMDLDADSHEEELGWTPGDS